MIDLDLMADRATNGAGCTKEEAQTLCSDALSLSTLYPHTSRIRQAFFGKAIHFCAIVNARSGACRENCKFCAQSAHHQTEAQVYPLQDDTTLLEAADKMKHSGAGTFGIVTSGPTVSDSELTVIGDTVQKMEGQTGLKPCASLGSLNGQQFDQLKAQGLTRFHHNLETSERFFPNICTTHSWTERVQTIQKAKEAGLEVCSGGLFGLGETWDDRIDMALTLRELEVLSVPINFLNAVEGTPLAGQARLTADEALRIIAVYRFLLPRATLRVCGGRPVVLGARQKEMFEAGANAIMTGDYLTVSGITPETDRALVESLGLEVES